jgi:L-fuconolactonase
VDAVVDPHHHLWDHPTSRYLVDELRADIDSAPFRVERTVFVECGSAYREDGPEAFRPVGETEFVAALAEEEPRIAGIVGFADLRVPEIVDVLAAHVEAGKGRFKGIRHASAHDPSPDVRVTHTHPPPDLFADPAFRSGMAALGDAGLGFDAYLYHPQLPQLVDLARAVPDVAIVLDHLGTPLGIGPYAGRRDEVLDRWRADMAEVAACPNVTLKLGGIGMPIFGLGWHRRPEPPTAKELADAWGDEIRWCIERFGADRCMFESNFPVDKASCSYATLWEAFDLVADGASDGERDALFRDTAARVYRLD